MKKITQYFLITILIFTITVSFMFNPSVCLASNETSSAEDDILSASEEPDALESENPTDNISDTINLVAYYKGEVLSVQTITFEEDPSMSEYEIKQVSQVKILVGVFSDRVYSFTTTYNLEDPKQIILEQGTIVMLTAMLTKDRQDIESISIMDYYRTDMFLWVFLITVGIVLIVCLFKGLKTLIGIIIMALGLYFYFVPLMLKGFNPILLMIPLCIIVGSTTIILDLGFSQRSASSIAGMLSGTLFAGIAGFIIEKNAHLVGLGETELQMFLYMNEHIPISFTGISFALAMLISMGGVIDTVSGLTEEMSLMKANNPYITKASLISYGLNKGRYNMSRNINTIFYTILAVILPVWIIYISYETPLIEILNMDYISSLFLRAFAAIIGIVLSMPVTAFIYATLLKKDSMYS